MKMKQFRPAILIVILLATAYILEALLLPPDAQSVRRFGVSETTIKLLGLTVTLPLIGIWFVGLYSYLKLSAYTKLISGSEDGKAFALITRGLLILTLWLPISSVISNALSYIYHQNSAITATMVIMNNYFVIMLLLGAFFLTWKGSEMLARTVKRPPRMSFVGVTAALFVVFSALYTYAVTHNPDRRIPHGGNPANSYYLPDPLLLTTIVVPYIFIWLLGTRTVQNIYHFRTNVKGVIYRQGLAALANGFAAVVLAIMSIRYIVSLSLWFNSLALKYVLIVVYLLVFGVAIGFSLLASGAKRLKQIEEV